MKKKIFIAFFASTMIASCAMVNHKPSTNITTKPCVNKCTTINESGTCAESCIVSTISESGINNSSQENIVKPQAAILIQEPTALKIGVNNQISFTLLRPDNTQIKADNLQTEHTQKVHVMLIDPTLTDYQHIHPILVKSPDGEKFTFDFIPKSPSYIMWADIKPNNGEQEYVRTTLGPIDESIKPNQKINIISQIGAYKVNLVFDGEVKENTMTMLIAIITKNGKQVNNLQPIMGASAHIAVFANDGQTLIHAHPTENANTKKGVIAFHLDPKSAGYAKMFVQFKVNGTEYFAPFGFNIKPSK